MLDIRAVLPVVCYVLGSVKVMSALECGFFIKNFPTSISSICVVVVIRDIMKLLFVELTYI